MTTSPPPAAAPEPIPEALGTSQPLESNLRALAKNPKAAIKAFDAEWAGWCAASALDALAAPPAQSEPQAAAYEACETNAVAWAVDRWHKEVSNRPMINVHRRTLDDTWRQVIRHFGGDPETLLGPSHDALRAKITTKEWEAMNGEPQGESADALHATLYRYLRDHSATYSSPKVPIQLIVQESANLHLRAGANGYRALLDETIAALAKEQTS